MEQRVRIVSKFYRLKMSGELRTMIESLPVRIEREVASKDRVYLGRGALELSGGRHEAEVSIQLQDGRLMAGVTVPSAGIRVEGPFETPEEMAAFPTAVRKAVVAAMD
jgi:hypothetical protein